jgi:probable HAF family extracellular repeat protein
MKRRTGMKHDTLLYLIITLLSVTSLLASAQEQDTKQSGPPLRYTLTDLGTLGGTFSQAFGVNDKGWVVGFATTEGDISAHAFLWRRGVMTDLGTLGGSDPLPFSVAGSINNRGEIVGLSQTSIADPLGENFCGNFLVCLPVVWRRGEITTLPTLGGNNGVANGINNRGQIIGHTETAQLDPTCDPPQVLNYQPVIWEKGYVHKLPTIPGDPDGFVNAINDKGQAGGDTVACNLSSGHPVLWQNGKATAITGMEPVDINNRGEATGTGGDANGVQHAALWKNGVVTILETLPDAAESHGNSLNDKGQVTGQSCSANGWPDCTVFVWQNGIVRDLNAIATPGSSLFALDTGRMNARGQIVGFAVTDAGEGHAFLATPCDQENEEDEGCRTQEQSFTRLALRPRTTIAVPDRIQRILQKGQTHPLPMSSRGKRLTR